MLDAEHWSLEKKVMECLRGSGCSLNNIFFLCNSVSHLANQSYNQTYSVIWFSLELWHSLLFLAFIRSQLQMLGTHFPHAVVFGKDRRFDAERGERCENGGHFWLSSCGFAAAADCDDLFFKYYANSSATSTFISITERSIVHSSFCFPGACFIFLSICNINCRKYNSRFTQLLFSADRKHSQPPSSTYFFHYFCVDLLDNSCL